MFAGEEFEISFRIRNPDLDENSENDRNVSNGLKKLYQLLLIGVISLCTPFTDPLFQIH